MRPNYSVSIPYSGLKSNGGSAYSITGGIQKILAGLNTCKADEDNFQPKSDDDDWNLDSWLDFGYPNEQNWTTTSTLQGSEEVEPSQLQQTC